MRYRASAAGPLSLTLSHGGERGLGFGSALRPQLDHAAGCNRPMETFQRQLACVLDLNQHVHQGEPELGRPESTE